MAVFRSYSEWKNIEMLALDFRELLPADLNGEDAELTPTSIVFAHDGVEFDVEVGYEDRYEGSFVYERDASDAVISVSGRVHALSRADWFDHPMPDLADGNSFSISGIDIDLALFGTLSPLELARIIFSGNDVIHGGSFKRSDILHGFEGNDEIWAYDRDDVIYGGKGADTMHGGRHDDTYYVDQKGDVVVELAGQGTDVVYSLASFKLGLAVEQLVLRGERDLNGTGNAQANELTGNHGANVLRGGAGADTIRGGAGGDRLHGDAGADVLRGQQGADTFFYRDALHSTADAADRIQDFQRGVDRINLAGIDANDLTPGNGAFRFIGAAQFDPSSAAGQLRFRYNSAKDVGMLLGSTDADTDAEIVIKLPGVQSLSPTDLVL